MTPSRERAAGAHRTRGRHESGANAEPFGRTGRTPLGGIPAVAGRSGEGGPFLTEPQGPRDQWHGDQAQEKDRADAAVYEHPARHACREGAPAGAPGGTVTGPLAGPTRAPVVGSIP